MTVVHEDKKRHSGVRIGARRREKRWLALVAVAVAVAWAGGRGGRKAREPQKRGVNGRGVREGEGSRGIRVRQVWREEPESSRERATFVLQSRGAFTVLASTSDAASLPSLLPKRAFSPAFSLYLQNAAHTTAPPPPPTHWPTPTPRPETRSGDQHL